MCAERSLERPFQFVTLKAKLVYQSAQFYLGFHYAHIATHISCFQRLILVPIACSPRFFKRSLIPLLSLHGFLPTSLEEGIRKGREREGGGGRGTQDKDNSHTYKQNEGLQFGGLEIVANT